VTWRVLDGLLVLDRDGIVSVPSAATIFNHALRSPDPELAPIGSSAPSSQLALKFSAYPGELRIEIHSETAPEAGAPRSPAPRLRVAATLDGDMLAELTSKQLSAGHFVADGCWYPLAPDQAALVEGRLREIGAEPGAQLSLRQYLELRRSSSVTSLVRDLTGESIVPPDRAERESREPEPALHGLYPYQRDGLRWLCFVHDERIGGILADEMGLGKTVQIIALLLSRPHSALRPALIVGPTSILENWKRELQKFAPSLRALIHRGAERTGFPAVLRDVDVVVTSYDTMVRDSPLLRQVNWSVVILDEAQAIKNPDAQRTRIAKRLPRDVSVAVTGTPMENRLADLWSLTDFVLPGYLGDVRDFEKEYSNDAHGGARLASLLSPLMLRRRVADVASDLPERIDIPNVIDMPESEARHYEALRSGIESEYGAGVTLAALTKLRMFCTHSALLDPSVSDLAAASQKYTRLLEILEEVRDSGEKALVFTAYQRMIDLLVTDLPARLGVPTSFIDGRTAVDERQSLIDQFSASDRPSVLALNPRAAGVGLNITAATHVLHYTLEWNPAIEDQASARAHRRGQTRPVTIHRLFYADTVEEVIEQRLNRKRALAEAAVTGTDASSDEYEDLMRAIRASPPARGT